MNISDMDLSELIQDPIGVFSLRIDQSGNIALGIEHHDPAP
jgi:hypothetical protein